MNTTLNMSLKKAGLSRQKMEYLNGILFINDLQDISQQELKKMST